MIRKRRSKWTKEGIDQYFFKHIAPLIKEGSFPTHKYLFNNNFGGFYAVLSLGKVHGYPNIKSFCQKHSLTREFYKKNIWTREFTDLFYKECILPFVEDKYMPPTKWFFTQGGNFWGFVGVLNSGKVQGYKSMKDFKKQNNIHTGRKRKWTKAKIDSFFTDFIQEKITGEVFPNSTWFKSRGGDYGAWIRGIHHIDSGYKDISDFAKKHNYLVPRKMVWSTERVENIYTELFLPLIIDNKFPSFSSITKKGGIYVEFYNVIRNSRIPEYKGIKDFKKKKGLR